MGYGSPTDLAMATIDEDHIRSGLWEAFQITKVAVDQNFVRSGALGYQVDAELFAAGLRNQFKDRILKALFGPVAGTFTGH